jgi:aldehyde:ferredoxin oxidoreductase
MLRNTKIGYTAKILQVDLTKREFYGEEFKHEDRIKRIGGAGLGAKIFWEEVPTGVSWHDPNNGLILKTSPLAGTG